MKRRHLGWKNGGRDVEGNYQKIRGLKEEQGRGRLSEVTLKKPTNEIILEEEP